MITALILQQDTTVFVSPAGVAIQKTAGASSEYMTGIGLLAPIPTPADGALLDGDYWATPVTDNGVITSWTYTPYNLNDPAQNNPPNVQSFAVFRIWRGTVDAAIDRVVVGTSAQYLTAAAGGAALPTTLGTGVYQVPCSLLCNQNANGQYYTTFALPVLAGNSRYFPYGFLNGVAFTGGTSTGYSTPAALLSFLNAVWTNVGTGSPTILWSLSVDNLTLTATETAPSSLGAGNDTICVAIGQVNPSL
jgi:hypothetical protein